MRYKSVISNALVAMFLCARLDASSVPIQRIDIANMLWNQSAGGGAADASKTPVQIAFQDEGLTPCFTTILPFQNATTVWAGSGQACSTPIISVMITPLGATSGIGVVYTAPPVLDIDSSLYSTQIILSQLSAPVFDPLNGAIISVGTSQMTSVNYLKLNGW